MDVRRKITILFVLFSYAFGASTFSHMLTMNHPSAHTSTIMNMDHSNHVTSDNDNAENKCIQTCKDIEKGKISSFLHTILIKHIIFNPVTFSVTSLESLHSIPLSQYYIAGGPPGEFTFSRLHLADIASIVLTI